MPSGSLDGFARFTVLGLNKTTIIEWYQQLSSSQKRSCGLTDSDDKKSVHVKWNFGGE